MPKLSCFECGKKKHYSPSHIPKRAFCSRKCYSKIRNKELSKAGSDTRIKGNENYKKTYHYGPKHHGWKGSKVGYRGLHRWLQKELGKPDRCKSCGKIDSRPRMIQWANIDQKYRRILTDYIPLCGSCHKNYDMAFKARKD